MYLRLVVIFRLKIYTACLLQISHASAPAAEFKTRLKTLFNALPAFTYISLTYIQLMKEFNWKKLLIITQDMIPYTVVRDFITKKE